MSADHRSIGRGFYDRLQLDGYAEARALLEESLEDTSRTYEQICAELNSSGLFESLKGVKPQDLSRYRARKARAEGRARVIALIEQDEGNLFINAAAKNPTGVIAKFLRRQLAESAVARFEDEMEVLSPLEISRESARHATVEQRDRKLDIEEAKADLDRRRIELAERQTELQRDKFCVAAKTWQFILHWFSSRETSVVDRMTKHSDELLTDLEGFIETNG